MRPNPGNEEHPGSARLALFLDELERYIGGRRWVALEMVDPVFGAWRRETPRRIGFFVGAAQMPFACVTHFIASVFEGFAKAFHRRLKLATVAHHAVVMRKLPAHQ